MCPYIGPESLKDVGKSCDFPLKPLGTSIRVNHLTQHAYQLGFLMDKLRQFVNGWYVRWKVHTFLITGFVERKRTKPKQALVQNPSQTRSICPLSVSSIPILSSSVFLLCLCNQLLRFDLYRAIVNPHSGQTHPPQDSKYPNPHENLSFVSHIL